MTKQSNPFKRVFRRILSSGSADNLTDPASSKSAEIASPPAAPVIAPDEIERQPRPRTDQAHRKAPPQPRDSNAPKAPAAAATKSQDWDISSFPVPEEEGRTRFHDFNLAPSIMHALADLDFRYCTPIQAQVLPYCLDGRDAAGQAQTGTGKTAAFLVTALQHLLDHPTPKDHPKGTPRALILAPTRELVIQIENDARDLAKYAGISMAAVFGGMDFNKQKNFLEQNQVDLIAATPGRLLDFNGRNVIDLRRVEILVIDEADRMLDMGFIPDIRRIVRATPHKSKRQTLFFSATLTSDVMRLSEQWTRDPVRIEVAPEQVAVDTIGQKVYILKAEQKFVLLLNMIRKENLDRVLVFTNRRDQARDLCDRLQGYGLNTSLLSGEVHQKKRLSVLEGFREGKINVVVATDVAARGLHVDDISHVVNYNLPDNPEDYVHRIGRTGRAGATGTSVSFACEEEGMNLPEIEEFIGEQFIYDQPSSELLAPLEEPLKSNRPKAKSSRPRSGGDARLRSGGRGRSSAGRRDSSRGSRRPR